MFALYYAQGLIANFADSPTSISLINKLNSIISKIELWVHHSQPFRVWAIYSDKYLIVWTAHYLE